VNPVLGRQRIHNCLPCLSSVRLCRLRGTCLRTSACPRGSPRESKKARSSAAPVSPTLRTWRSRPRTQGAPCITFAAACVECLFLKAPRSSSLRGQSSCAKRESTRTPPRSPRPKIPRCQTDHTEALLNGPELFSGLALLRSGPHRVLLFHFKCVLRQCYCTSSAC
jgi:hypothetical protein